MPVFKCSKCGALDNTALANYWAQVYLDNQAPLCSECDPEIGKWHGQWEKRSPEEMGLVVGPDGFYYEPGEEYLKRQISELPPGAERPLKEAGKTGFVCEFCQQDQHGRCLGFARESGEKFRPCACENIHPRANSEKRRETS